MNPTSWFKEVWCLKILKNAVKEKLNYKKNKKINKIELLIFIRSNWCLYGFQNQWDGLNGCKNFSVCVIQCINPSKSVFLGSVT